MTIERKICPYCKDSMPADAIQCAACGGFCTAVVDPSSTIMESSGPGMLHPGPGSIPPPPPILVDPAAPIPPGPGYQSPEPTGMYPVPPPDRFLDGWNWGAFAFGWIWGVNHRAYNTIASTAACLILLAFGVMVFELNHPMGYDGFAGDLSPWEVLLRLVFWGTVLGCSVWHGVKGNQWAWKSGRFPTLEDCKRCQYIWSLIGGIVFGVQALLFVGLVLIGAYSEMNDNQSPAGYPNNYRPPQVYHNPPAPIGYNPSYPTTGQPGSAPPAQAYTPNTRLPGPEQRPSGPEQRPSRPSPQGQAYPPGTPQFIYGPSQVVTYQTDPPGVTDPGFQQTPPGTVEIQGPQGAIYSTPDPSAPRNYGAATPQDLMEYLNRHPELTQDERNAVLQQFGQAHRLPSEPGFWGN